MPHLQSGGKPVNQRKQKFPSEQRLCRCQDCSSETAVDPLTLAVYKGKYVGPQEWKSHQSQERARNTASAHFDANSDTPSPNQPGSSTSGPLPSDTSLNSSPSSHPFSSPSPPTSFSPQRIIGHVDAERRNDQLMVTLRSIQAVLGRCRVVDIVADKPLVFSSPPTHRSSEMISPISDALVLLEGANCNTEPIKHGTWLDLALELVQDQGSTSGDINVRLLSTVLTRDLVSETESIGIFKMHEWNHQRQAACEAGALVERVNTGVL